MAIFTVHLPPPSGAGVIAPEKIVMLRDGFSWPAFFFGPLWLAWRRAWTPALLYTLALVAVGMGAWKAQLGKDAFLSIGLAMGVALGFEGVRLVAWSLARSGYEEKTLVVGDDLDQAEQIFFHNWRPAAPPQPAEERPV